MIQLKNISGAMLMFYGMLESGSAVFFKPDETLEFSEVELNGKWRQIIAKYGSASIQIVETANKEESKPKAETPAKKPAVKQPAAPKSDDKTDEKKSESESESKGEAKTETPVKADTKSDATNPKGEAKAETPAKPDAKSDEKPEGEAK